MKTKDKEDKTMELESTAEALRAGETKLLQGSFQTAVEQAESSIKIAAEASYQLGKIAEDDINFQEAFEHYKKAVQLRPKNSRYLNKAGDLAKNLGKPQQAVEYLSLALESDLKNYGEDHPHVAIIRRGLGLAKKALAECKEKEWEVSWLD